eukprot:363611-Chlamydomonas_euryale.AAC.8
MLAVRVCGVVQRLLPWSRLLFTPCLASVTHPPRPWLCQFTPPTTLPTHAMQAPWWRPNRRDFVVAGIGSIFGGAAMFVYDTCECGASSCKGVPTLACTTLRLRRATLWISWMKLLWSGMR